MWLEGLSMSSSLEASRDSQADLAWRGVSVAL